MDMNRIIRELRRKELITPLPEGSHVPRREHRYGDEILEAIRVGGESDSSNGRESAAGKIADLDKLIYIPDGDIDDWPVIEERQFNDNEPFSIDMLAWYRSFHWEPVDKWGIYILDKGLYYIASQVLRGLDQQTKTGRPFNLLDLLQQSFRILFFHEYFHFVTDIAATAMEIGAQGSLSFRKYYSEYMRNVYLNPSRGDESKPLEEALANAFAFSRLSREGRLLRTGLRKFMMRQPNGYRAFDNYQGEEFRDGLRELATSISYSKEINPLDGMPPLEVVFDCRNRDVFYSDVPVYIVRTMRPTAFSVKFVLSIPRSLCIRTERFLRELDAVPEQIRYKCEKNLEKLEASTRIPGLNFEKLQGCDTVFTLRVDDNYRVSLRPRNAKWELLRIGTHKGIYRNPSGE